MANILGNVYVPKKKIIERAKERELNRPRMMVHVDEHNYRYGVIQGQNVKSKSKSNDLQLVIELATENNRGDIGVRPHFGLPALENDDAELSNGQEEETEIAEIISQNGCVKSKPIYRPKKKQLRKESSDSVEPQDKEMTPLLGNSKIFDCDEHYEMCDEHVEMNINASPEDINTRIINAKMFLKVKFQMQTTFNFKEIEKKGVYLAPMKTFSYTLAILGLKFVDFRAHTKYWRSRFVWPSGEIKKLKYVKLSDGNSGNYHLRPIIDIDVVPSVDVVYCGCEMYSCDYKHYRLTYFLRFHSHFLFNF